MPTTKVTAFHKIPGRHRCLDACAALLQRMGSRSNNNARKRPYMKVVAIISH